MRSASTPNRTAAFAATAGTILTLMAIATQSAVAECLDGVGQATETPVVRAMAAVAAAMALDLATTDCEATSLVDAVDGVFDRPVKCPRIADETRLPFSTDRLTYQYVDLPPPMC